MATPSVKTAASAHRDEMADVKIIQVEGLSNRLLYFGVQEATTPVVQPLASAWG